MLPIDYTCAELPFSPGEGRTSRPRSEGGGASLWTSPIAPTERSRTTIPEEVLVFLPRVDGESELVLMVSDGASCRWESRYASGDCARNSNPISDAIDTEWC